MMLSVTMYPYAVVWGNIEVPDGLSEDEIQEYLYEHFDEIEITDTDLDYAGTDMAWEEE